MDLFGNPLDDDDLETSDAENRRQIQLWSEMAEMLVSLDITGRGYRNTITRRDGWDIETIVKNKTLLLNVKATFPRHANGSCHFSGAGRGRGIGTGKRSKTAMDLRDLIGVIHGFALVHAPWGTGWRNWKINYMPAVALTGPAIIKSTRDFSPYVCELTWDYLLRTFERAQL